MFKNFSKQLLVTSVWLISATEWLGVPFIQYNSYKGYAGYIKTHKKWFVGMCVFYWALSSFAVAADSSLVCHAWLQPITHTFRSWTPVHFLPRGAWKHEHTVISQA